MGTIAAMSLPTPTPDRTPLHTRTLTFRGFARPDGLWDMEGELHDTKHYDHPNGPGTRLAGQAIHHLFVRVTLDAQLCIHDIATSMDTAPFGECSVADQHMRRFIGLTMGKGWRKTIEATVGGLQGCTHLRELLFNLATAAFQTLPAAFGGGDPDTPPRHLGQCTGWDFEGNGVKEYFPQFYGRGEANTQPSTPHNPTGKKSF